MQNICHYYKKYVLLTINLHMSSVSSAIMSGPMRVLGENNHPQFNDKGATVSTTELDELKNLLVVFNSKMVRNVSPDVVKNMISDIVQKIKRTPTDVTQNDMLVKFLVLAAYQRDIKDGKGEKDIFFHTVANLWGFYEKEVKVLLQSVIGSPLACWKDVLLMIEKFQFTHPGMTKFLFEHMTNAMKSDKDRVDNNENPATLVLKWAPRQQTHFDKKPLFLASRFAHELFTGEHKNVMANYRKLLSKATIMLGTVEYFMCEGKWELIDPAKVPAKAMKTYRKAFLNENCNDEGQRTQIPARIALAKKLTEFMSSGKSLHGSILMPYEIVHHLLEKNDVVLEAQLDNLVKEFVSNFSADIGLVLAMCDVSGSMVDAYIRHSSSQLIDVSIALSFLLSQLPGPFYNKMLTFSADPVIVDISDAQTNFDKIQKIKTIWDGNSQNTDFGKAMDYILRSLVDNKVDPTQVSNLTLVVFSDMQFDEARSGSGDYWDVAQERIEKMYTENGFPVPKMVYWNLANSNGHPAHAETKGVTMLSGFNQGALKSFLVGDLTQLVDEKGVKLERTPYESLCLSLDKYQWLMKKFEGVCEGYFVPVRDIEWEKDEEDEEYD